MFAASYTKVSFANAKNPCETTGGDGAKKGKGKSILTCVKGELKKGVARECNGNKGGLIRHCLWLDFLQCREWKEIPRSLASFLTPPQSLQGDGEAPKAE